MGKMRHDEIVIDFVDGSASRRFRAGGARGHALVRAAGVVRGNTPMVVDATAGLGRDAFLLASAGARVTLLERSAEVFALLEDALARAREARHEVAAIAARMTLVHGDAKDLLPVLRPEVVIVDPMHPPRRKTALVKKDMRLLRRLVGPDQDALALMQVALASARDRVVLKWPRLEQPLKGLPKPSFQIVGKTVRYDVFIVG